MDKAYQLYDKALKVYDKACKVLGKSALRQNGIGDGLVHIKLAEGKRKGRNELRNMMSKKDLSLLIIY